MNAEDPFEQKLASLKPRELPPEWRAEILGRAAAAAPLRVKAKRPPRWLVAGWGLAWAAVVVLHWMTPEATGSEKVSASVEDVSRYLDRTQTLYAFLNFNPDLNP